MKSKNFLFCTLVLIVGIGFCGCDDYQRQDSEIVSSVNNEDQEKSGYQKHKTGHGIDFYIDDTQLSTDQANEQEKIKDHIEHYIMSLYYAASGRSGMIVDGDLIREPGLAYELDSRYPYLANAYQNVDFSEVMPFLRYESLDIQEDTAKVIVSYSFTNPKSEKMGYEQQEGYIYVKDNSHWKLVNVIVDTGKGGADMIEKLRKSTNPQEWQTDFSYSQLKRSDYEDAPNFSDINY